MKKYRVTKEHAILKKDLFLSNYKKGLTDWFYSLPYGHDTIVSFGSNEISRWLKLGWIEEIQEPEFTRNQLIDFGNYYNINTRSGAKYTEEGIGCLIDSWIKFKDKP